MIRPVALAVFFCLGMFQAAAADCSAGAVAAARSSFKARYKAREFKPARDLLNEVWSECFADNPDGIVAAEIASDLALAQHRSGDSDDCLQTLSDFMPGFRTADRRLASLPERLRKAIVFNIGLCEKQCPAPGPGCLMARVAKAHARLDRSDFTTARDCGFEAGEGAKALSAELCVKIVPAKRHVDLAERDTASPAEICPGLALVRRNGKSDVLAIARASWLRNAETCCAEIDISADAAGRIRIAPAENPPEGCITGKRSHVGEDIYAPKSGGLKPVKQTLIPVR